MPRSVEVFYGVLLLLFICLSVSDVVSLATKEEAIVIHLSVLQYIPIPKHMVGETNLNVVISFY